MEEVAVKNSKKRKLEEDLSDLISVEKRVKWHKMEKKRDEVKSQEVVDSLEMAGLEQLFINLIIGENIAKYLSFHSMKTCRRVSKTMKNSITSTARFLTITRLRLNEKELGDLSEEELNSHKESLCQNAWRNLKVELTFREYFNMDFYNSYQFSLFFDSVADLHLTMIKPKEETYKFKSGSVEGLVFIKAFKSVQSLTMNALFTEQLKKILVFYDEEDEPIRPFFENLISFRIERPVDGKEAVYLLHPDDLHDEYKMWCSKDYQNTSYFLSSMENQKLTRFEIPVKITPGVVPKNKRLLEIFDYGFLKFAAQSASTIVTLSLNFDEFAKRNVKFMRFPALKNLRIRETKLDSSSWHQHHFDFLEIQPLEQLESLSLELTEVDSTLSSLLTARCGKIQSLYLKIAEFEEVDNWEFLRSFSALKIFTLIVPKLNKYKNNQALNNNEENEFIISQLVNEKMKKLSLRGINLHGLSSFILNGNNLMNLVHLSFLKCPRSLDDEKLEFISNNLTKLETFEFSHCQEVTDFGITGMKNTKEKSPTPSFSLNNLKKLRILRIISCNNVTNFSCQFGISFNGLKTFDCSSGLKFQTKITSEGVKFLIGNNPDLEEILLPSSLKKLKKDVKKLAEKRNILIKFPDNDWIREDKDHHMDEMLQ